VSPKIPVDGNQASDSEVVLLEFALRQTDGINDMKTPLSHYLGDQVADGDAMSSRYNIDGDFENCVEIDAFTSQTELIIFRNLLSHLFFL
jgi:hypothetical protein